MVVPRAELLASCWVGLMVARMVERWDVSLVAMTDALMVQRKVAMSGIQKAAQKAEARDNRKAWN